MFISLFSFVIFSTLKVQNLQFLYYYVIWDDLSLLYALFVLFDNRKTP